MINTIDLPSGIFRPGAVCYFDFYKGEYDTGAVYFHPISNVWDIEEALTCEADTMTVATFTPDQSGWYHIYNYDETEENTTTGDLWSADGSPENRSDSQWKLEADKTYIYMYRNYGRRKYSIRPIGSGYHRS